MNFDHQDTAHHSVQGVSLLPVAHLALKIES